MHSLRVNPQGWLIVAISFAALAMTYSARATLSFLMPVWEADPGWDRAAVASGGALMLLVMAVASPISGHLVDRHGPRPLYVTALIAAALGLGLTAQISSFWLFVILFCMLGGVSFGVMTMSVVTATIARQFDAYRGLATGLALAGSTSGLLIFMPALAAIVVVIGWRTTYAGMAVIALTLAVLAGLLFRTAPASRGAGAASGGARADLHDSRPLGARLRQLVGDRTFWLLGCGFVICGFTTAGVFEVHMLPYAAACGFAPMESATAYGVAGAANMAGLIVIGWLADRVHRPALLATMYFIRAATFVMLLNITGDYPLFLAFAVLFGFLNFATLPVVANMVGTHFGIRMMGLTVGLLFGMHSAGAAMGAYFGGVMFDLLAAYDWVWLVSLALAVVAGCLTLLIEERPRGPALAAA